MPRLCNLCNQQNDRRRQLLHFWLVDGLPEASIAWWEQKLTETPETVTYTVYNKNAIRECTSNRAWNQCSILASITWIWFEFSQGPSGQSQKINRSPSRDTEIADYLLIIWNNQKRKNHLQKLQAEHIPWTSSVDPWICYTSWQTNDSQHNMIFSLGALQLTDHHPRPCAPRACEPGESCQVSGACTMHDVQCIKYVISCNNYMGIYIYIYLCKYLYVQYVNIYIYIYNICTHDIIIDCQVVPAINMASTIGYDSSMGWTCNVN